MPWLQFPLPSPPPPISPLNLLLPEIHIPYLPQKREGLPGAPTKLGITNYIKIRPIFSDQGWMKQHSRRERVPKAGKRVSDNPHSPCQESHKNTKLHSHICRGLRPAPNRLPDLSESTWIQVSWFCGSCSWGVLDISGSLSPFFPVLCRPPQAQLGEGVGIGPFSCWMKFLINSARLWSQNSLQAGQEVCWRFCVWGGVPTPWGLAWYRVQKMAGSGSLSPFLGIFARVTLVDSIVFPLH